ncbi:MAG: DUF2911 domain-containing protein [Bacteroidota bacterium]
MRKYLFKTLLLIFVLNACNNAKQEMTEKSENVATTETPKETMTELEREHQLYRAGYADSVNQGLIEEDNFKGSARKEVTGNVGGTEISINYGSPGKRGRVLWNGLVSYDQVWVTGSHWATAVNFSKDVKIADTTVPAGMYGFFTIPGRENWTLIINKVYDQHLAEEYKESEDIVRITVQPETLDDVVQRLTYEIEETVDKQGNITMAWDQVKVAMPFVTM